LCGSMRAGRPRHATGPPGSWNRNATMEATCTPCPSREELLALHLGELDETQIARVGGHLLSCPCCEEEARRLDRLSDSVVVSLRQSLRAAAPELSAAATTGDSQGTAGSYPAGRFPQRGADHALPSRFGPPPEIPGYEMLGLIGCGGMSLVYQARQLRLNRLVAVKCVRAG